MLIADYQLKPEKTTVIYNGLKDEGRMIAEEERKKMKQSLSFDAEDSIILFVGRLDSIKGVDFLIKAFRRFIPFIVGTGKEAFWFPLAADTIGGLIMSIIGIFIFLPIFTQKK